MKPIDDILPNIAQEMLRSIEFPTSDEVAYFSFAYTCYGYEIYGSGTIRYRVSTTYCGYDMPDEVDISIEETSLDELSGCHNGDDLPDDTINLITHYLSKELQNL